MKQEAKQNPGIAHAQRSNKKRQGPKSLERMGWGMIDSYLKLTELPWIHPHPSCLVRRL